jgi:hypothetical protein
VCKCEIYDAVDTAHFPTPRLASGSTRLDHPHGPEPFLRPEVHSLTSTATGWRRKRCAAGPTAQSSVPARGLGLEPDSRRPARDANGTELKKSSVTWGLLTWRDRATWLWLLFITAVATTAGLWWFGAAIFGEHLPAAVPCEVVEFTPDKARLKEYLPEKLHDFVVESGCDRVTPYEARVSGLRVARPRSFVVRSTDSQTQFCPRFAFCRRPTPAGPEEVLWVKLGPKGVLSVPALNPADELIVVGCLSPRTNCRNNSTSYSCSNL